MDVNKADFDPYEAGIMFASAYRKLNDNYGYANENDPSGFIFIVPMLVNGCFAIELFLKSLLEISPKRHRLKDLMSLLKDQNESVYSQIKSASISVMRRQKGYVDYSSGSFDDDLASFDNAFCEWRYFYERNNISEVKRYSLDFLDSFVTAIENVCKLEKSFNQQGENIDE